MSEDSVEKYGLSPAETMILEDYRDKLPVFEKMRDFVCDLLKKKVAAYRMETIKADAFPF